MSLHKIWLVGSPKDRKKILKALKGKVMEACNHPSGYLLILRIFDVVDDTVNVQKSILSEMVRWKLLLLPLRKRK